ncbi:MAG: SpoIIE family protein phosphatase [Planctomycetota bacterium]|jgi:serine phosphatase RsbU (regulator of sigma subunit)
MKRLLSRIPVTVSVPFLLSIPLLLASAILITVASVQSRTTTRTLVSQSMTQLHGRIEQRVGDLLSLPRRVSALNARLVRQGRLDPRDPRGWRQTLADECHAFEMLSAIAWGSEDGRATWVARYAGEERLFYGIKDDRTGTTADEYVLDDDGTVAGDLFNRIEFDPRTRPWYRTPADAGKPTWTSPYVWVGGDPSIPPTLSIAYGWPIHTADGTLQGALESEITLVELSDFLESLEIAGRGVVMIIDDDGLLMANSGGAPVTRGSDVVPARVSEHPIIAGAAARLAGVGRLSAGAEEVVVDLDDERWWLRVSRLRHETGLDWTIATVVPQRHFMAAVVAARRRSVWIVLAAVVVTAVLGIGIALFMVRPLLVLESHAKRIGEGDLETRLQLHLTPELARLSDSINEMTDGLRDRMRLRKSLELAMQVQQNLLPADSPRVKGLDIAGHSTYCDETGGDYYDFLDVVGLSETGVGVAVADVMGHGIAAAMLMANARGILRSRSCVSESLADLLTHVNGLLAHDTGGTRFMTMLLLVVEADERVARWASAGHGPPLVYDPSADAFLELEGGGLPLGTTPDVRYEQYEITSLRPGMILLAATDGVWEAPDAEGRRFGKERVREQIRRTSDLGAEAIGAELRQSLADFMGATAQEDDATIVLVKIRPQSLSWAAR